LAPLDRPACAFEEIGAEADAHSARIVRWVRVEAVAVDRLMEATDGSNAGEQRRAVAPD
jgi:hypothetical protein